MNKDKNQISDVIKNIYNLEEKLIHHALTSLLGCEPGVEDYKKVNLFSSEQTVEFFPFYQYMSYDNLKVCKIEYTLQGLTLLPLDQGEYLQEAIVDGKLTFKDLENEEWK